MLRVFTTPDYIRAHMCLEGNPTKTIRRQHSPVDNQLVSREGREAAIKSRPLGVYCLSVIIYVLILISLVSSFLISPRQVSWHAFAIDDCLRGIALGYDAHNPLRNECVCVLQRKPHTHTCARARSKRFARTTKQQQQQKNATARSLAEFMRMLSNCT